MVRGVRGASPGDPRRRTDQVTASKTTLVRCSSPAVMSEPSSATGSAESSSDSTRTSAGTRGTCEDGDATVTATSTSYDGWSRRVASSAANDPAPTAADGHDRRRRVVGAVPAAATAASSTRAARSAYDAWSPPTRRRRSPVPASVASPAVTRPSRPGR